MNRFIVIVIKESAAQRLFPEYVIQNYMRPYGDEGFLSLVVGRLRLFNENPQVKIPKALLELSEYVINIDVWSRNTTSYVYKNRNGYADEVAAIIHACPPIYTGILPSKLLKD